LLLSRLERNLGQRPGVYEKKKNHWVWRFFCRNIPRIAALMIMSQHVREDMDYFGGNDCYLRPSHVSNRQQIVKQSSREIICIMTPRGAFGFGLDLLLAVAVRFGIASMKRVRYIKGVTSTPNSTLDTPTETLKMQTVQDAADSLKR
jgi:hypothetical protein